MSSAENGKPAGRLVWMGDDDAINLEWLVWFFRQPAGAVDDTQEWAQSMLDRMDAAPADPAEAIGTALIECEYRSPGMGGDPEPLHDLYMPPGAAIVRRNAVLQALGVPSPSPIHTEGQ